MKRTTHPVIDFHGDSKNCGERLRKLTEQKKATCVKAVDGAGWAYEAAKLRREKGVAHFIIYRQTAPGRRGDDHPDLDKTPEEAAKILWAAVLSTMPKELVEYKDIIFIEPTNEPGVVTEKPEQAKWVGQFCVAIAKLMLADGWNPALAGFNAGTPSPEFIRSYFVDLLRLFEKNWDRCLWTLHEAKLGGFKAGLDFKSKGLAPFAPYLINSSQQVFGICDELGIRRPRTFISEFAWSHNDIPDAAQFQAEVQEACQMDAAWPEIVGRTIYTTHSGGGMWSRLRNKLNDQSPWLTEYVTETMLTADVQSPAKPKPPEQKPPEQKPPKDPNDQTGVSVGTGLPKIKKSTVKLQQTLTGFDESINAVKLVIRHKGADGPFVKDKEVIIPLPTGQLQINLMLISAEFATTHIPTTTPPDDLEAKGILPVVSHPDSRLQGVDVSEYQLPSLIDYKALKKAGVEFAFVRASRGTTTGKIWIKDTKYETHMQKFKEAGILRGSYHALYEEDPAEQARGFFETMQPGELPPVLDIEKGQYTGQLSAEIVEQFMQEWKKLGGERPIIYTNQSTWHELIKKPAWSRDYILWVANWVEGDNPDAMPDPWKREDWRFWQNKKGQIDGYRHEDKYIDLNWFKGNLEDLKRLSKWQPGDLEEPREPLGEVVAGWMSLDVLDVAADRASAVVKRNWETANVRTGSGKDRHPNPLGTIKGGTRVTITGPMEPEFEYYPVHVQGKDLTRPANVQPADLNLPANVQGADLTRPAITTGWKATHWPTDDRTITQRFGENPTDYPKWEGGHEGIDIRCLIGKPYYAIADGTVIKCSNTNNAKTGESAYGWHVVVDHGNGFTSLYAHADQRQAVKVGQVVKGGEIVATSGNTGNSSGPHLHLTIKKEGSRTPGYPAGYVDPWPYIEHVRPSGKTTPPQGGIDVLKIDVLKFMKGDPRYAFEVRHPSGGQERIQTQYDPHNANAWYYVKNQLWEHWRVENELIWLCADVSPSNADDGTHRCYVVSKDGQYGSPYARTRMQVGEPYTDHGHVVQFYAKNSGSKHSQNSGGAKNVTTLVAHKRNYSFNTYNQEIRLDEVIEVKGNTETHWFAIHQGISLGRVAWESAWGRSEITELHRTADFEDKLILGPKHQPRNRGKRDPFDRQKNDKLNELLRLNYKVQL